MKSKLTEILRKETGKKLKQEQKFMLRYGKDYIQVLGSKYQNPLYDLTGESVLIPDKFGEGRGR